MTQIAQADDLGPCPYYEGDIGPDFVDPSERRFAEVRLAVTDYVRFAPNQGGDETTREHIRSAFFIIRSRLRLGWSIQSAIGEVERFAYSMADM